MRGIKPLSSIDENGKMENKMIADSIKKLYLISGREEALKYLSQFKVVDLKKIAKESKVFIKSKSKKAEIIYKKSKEREIWR